MVAASAGPNEQQLHEANSFNTNNEHHPLERTVCINIRASLSDLCLRANAATWSPPSAEATKAIYQQARPGPEPTPFPPRTSSPRQVIRARGPRQRPRQRRQRRQRRSPFSHAATPHAAAPHARKRPSRTLRRPFPLWTACAEEVPRPRRLGRKSGRPPLRGPPQDDPRRPEVDLPHR
jgi:hypothetical protein